MEACAFCPNLAVLTGEHLFDDWVSRAFKSTGYNIRKYDPSFSKGERIVTGEWRAPTINMKAKVVCGDCNNGWMSQLSDHLASSTFKNMISSTSAVTLGRLDLVAMSAYLFMKAVIVDHMHPTRRPFFQPRLRYAFTNDLTPPPSAQAWLGCFESRLHKSGGLVAGHYLKPRERPINGFEIYVFTYVINHVALQMTAFRWIKPGPRRGEFPKLRQHVLWAEATDEFYPILSDSVIWPPSKLISDDTSQAFVNRWSRLEMAR